METNNIDSINKQSKAIKEYDENLIKEENDNINIEDKIDKIKQDIQNESINKENLESKSFELPDIKKEEEKEIPKKKLKKNWVNIAINYFFIFLKYYGFSIIIIISLFIITKIFEENTIFQLLQQLLLLFIISLFFKKRIWIIYKILYIFLIKYLKEN